MLAVEGALLEDRCGFNVERFPGMNKHDELLLRDLKLQPLWLLWGYVALGVAAAIAGFTTDHNPLSKVLCVGAGFLIALGAEKLVTRRIRNAALAISRHSRS